MGRGDHCAVWGCTNDRRYPQNQHVLPHVGVLRFFSPLEKADRVKWEKLINRKDFKVTSSTKVCSNHFSLGYRCKTSCRHPTLFLKGYNQPVPNSTSRLPPRVRVSQQHQRKRKATDADLDPTQAKKSVPSPSSTSHSADKEILGEKSIFDPLVVNNNDEDLPLYTDKACQTPYIPDSKIRRLLFVEQATSTKNCYKYTGLSREKLDLIFDTIKGKAENLRYWRGSVDTRQSNKRRKRGVPRILTVWEEFILVLVRNRKGFDVHFLADTLGITSGQVSRIFNTWVIFLSSELSFLVPWPTVSEVKKATPKRFGKFPNLRLIIDCAEFYIQKPSIPSSQKITWSSYKHWNTVKLLVGITPSGVISFIPPLWTGLISDKEIVRSTGLVDLLDEGDTVMADRGFLIRDLLTFKKVKLVTPAYCKGSRLSSRGTTHSRRVASLRSHVERYILKLKQFRILSGVIPLVMKPMLDRIIFLCAALSNLGKKSIKYDDII